MKPGLIELIGVMLLVVGACGLVAAASFVSIALAVLVAALVLMFAGVTVTYVAAMLDKPEPEKRPRP